MPPKNPHRLSSDRDRHGNLRWYVRLPGKAKIRLRAEYGSEQFWEEYRDALAGKKPSRPTQSEIESGSFRALVVKYISSPEFRALDVSTKSWRRRELEAVCRSKGALPVARMEHRHVRKLRDERADTPGAANQRLKAMTLPPTSIQF